MRWNPLHGALARACGAPVAVEVEKSHDPARVDHLWIDVNCGEAGFLRGAVNTFSRRNEAAGFDARVRVGIVRSRWEELPEVGLFASAGLDYAEIEGRANVFYETMTRRDLELWLIAKAAGAVRVEMWGQYHTGARVGLHQVHSRRASCAVAEDIVGRDGALKFYREEERAAVMVLLKFCGQP